MLRECAVLIAAISVTRAVPRQESPPKKDAPASLLDRLIEKSRQVKSFRATFTMTYGDEPPPVKIRCDFRAPDAVRVEVVSDQYKVTTWCVDRVIVIREDDPDLPQGRFTRLDLRDFDAAYDTIDAVLMRNFGEANGAKIARPSRAALRMMWSIDPATKQGDFSISGGAGPDDASPFGWLETLRDKMVVPTVDRDALRFSTDDGHCDVVISREDGFLREFVGRGAEKTVRIHFETMTVNPAEEAGEFEPPRDAAGREDRSISFRTQMERDEVVRVGAYICDVITTAAGDAPWDDKLHERIVEVVRPLDDWALHTAYDPWLPQMRNWIADIVAHLRQFKSDGLAATQIDEWRALAKKQLEVSLAEAKQHCLAEVAAPKSAKFPERAERLCAIEREVIAQRFDALIRDPLVAGFAKVTGTAQK